MPQLCAAVDNYQLKLENGCALDGRLDKSMENWLNMIIRHRAVSTQWYCQNSIDILRWLGLNFLSQVLRFRPPFWSFARIYSVRFLIRLYYLF